MKRHLKVKRIVYAAFLLMGIFCFSNCKDDPEKIASEHDPGKPIEITDFTPKEGSARTRLYIYGKNFGEDISQISVKIGDIPAKVVGSNGEIIYCIVPFRAIKGTVEVSVGPDSVYTKATDTFKYMNKTLVSTLCGYVDETGKTEVKDGTFSECGFEGPRWLTVDPKNKHQIYLVDGFGISIRTLDVERDSVSTLIQRGQGNWENIRQVEFTLSGDTMLVANEKNADQAIAVSTMTRQNGFKRPQHIIYAKQNNTCTVHPHNGELYYNSRLTGELMRYDWELKKGEILYTIKNRDCQFFVFFHPTGNYAYMNIPNKKIIMKAEYDWANKTLKNANIFCGAEGKEGCVDGQGTNALLGNPMQGCFVKNEKYVQEGREDVYDFYFCDQNSHAIRYLTPDGFVYTYAGRGSKGVNGNAYGYIDGDLKQEARFDQPVGITYDDENKIFYIGDYANKRIRTIAIDE